MVWMALHMGASGIDFGILAVLGAPMTPVSNLLIAHAAE
jgi:hypothetical protein